MKTMLLTLLFASLLGASENRANFNEKDFIKENKQKCEEGDKKSCYKLGDFMYSKNDVEIAKEYYNKSCEKNLAEGCFALDNLKKKN